MQRVDRARDGHVGHGGRVRRIDRDRRAARPQRHRHPVPRADGHRRRGLRRRRRARRDHARARPSWGSSALRLLSRRKRATIGAEVTPAKAAKPIAPMSNLRAILTVLGTVVALLVIAIPSHVDAARPARRRQRAGRIDQLPGVPDHRGGVRRGRERTAARHRDGIRPDQRRRPPRHPGRGRPAARGPRRRGRGRADRDIRRQHAPRLPGGAGGGAQQRVDRAARAGHPRPPAGGRRPHARRGRSGGEQHRHLGGAERRPADLPRWSSSACRSSS